MQQRFAPRSHLGTLSLCVAFALGAACQKAPPSNAESAPSPKTESPQTGQARATEPSTRSPQTTGSGEPEGAGGAPGKPAPPPSTDGLERFGAPLRGLKEVALSEVLAAPERHQGAELRLSGTARRVCLRKGCWMELAASEAADAPGCRVKFKDYAFFVPTDAAGAKVTVEGSLQVTTVKPARVRHLENEGARFSSKNADGSANEVQLVATGVELDRP